MTSFSVAALLKFSRAYWQLESLHEARRQWREVTARLRALHLPEEIGRQVELILRRDTVRDVINQKVVSLLIKRQVDIIGNLGALGVPFLVVVATDGNHSVLGWSVLYGGYLLPTIANVLLAGAFYVLYKRGFFHTHFKASQGWVRQSVHETPHPEPQDSFPVLSPIGAVLVLMPFSIAATLPVLTAGLVLRGPGWLHSVVDFPTMLINNTLLPPGHHLAPRVGAGAKVLVQVALSWLTWSSFTLWVRIPAILVAQSLPPPRRRRQRSLTDASVVALAFAVFEVTDARWDWRRPDQRRSLIRELEDLARGAERDLPRVARYAGRNSILERAAALRGAQVAAALRAHQQAILEAVWQVQFEEVQRDLLCQVAKLAVGDWSILPEPPPRAIFVPRLRRLSAHAGPAAALGTAAVLLPLLPGVSDSALNGVRATLAAAALLSLLGTSQETRERVVTAVRSAYHPERST
jgi:hypothetical protein